MAEGSCGRRLAYLVLIAAVAMPANAQSVASAFTTGYRYDLLGREIGRILADPDGAGPLHFKAIRNTYDSDGRLTKVEYGELSSWQSESIAPINWTGFSILNIDTKTYDRDSRITTDLESDNLGNGLRLTQYSYDPLGRQTCAATRMNISAFGSLPSDACTLGAQGSVGSDRITKTTFDPFGQILSIARAYGTADQSVTSYTYSKNGQRVTLTDPRGYLAKMTYDDFDRQAAWYFPSPTSTGISSTVDYEQYGYDPNGNRTSLKKRNGSTITYQFDGLNRVTTKLVPSAVGLPASATRSVYYGYDVRDRQLYVRFDSASGPGITNSYNNLGDLTSSTNNVGSLSLTLGYSWDSEGHRLSVTHPDGQVFTYTRDGLNRVNGIYEGVAQGSTSQLAVATWNYVGLPAALQRSTAGNGFLATYGYDPIGRLNSLTNDAAGTANDLTITQSLSPASQILTHARSNDAYAWTGAMSVNRNYSTNGINQYTAAGSASFCYDASGNLTADGSSVYLYDLDNRLIQKNAQTSTICPTSTSGYTGALQASLTYDPLGRLYQTNGGAAGLTTFLYDGDELVAEYDGSNLLKRRYVHSDNADDPMVEYDGSAVGGSTRTFLMPDEQRSIIALINNDGSARNLNSYDEYGIPGASNQGRFQYTGQAWIPELGMYYYKARIYSPTLGRFLQTDSVGYSGGLNLYAYVLDDPVNSADPTGNDPYVAGRLLDQWVLGTALQLDHAFIAYGARYPGDPKATIVSFGKLANGNLGNVNDPNRAADVSKKTHATDIRDWLSLATAKPQAWAQRIDAKDSTVAAAAKGVQENAPYWAVPYLDLAGRAANSNSAAHAVADSATEEDGGTPTPKPGAAAGEDLPGWAESWRVTVLPPLPPPPKNREGGAVYP